MRLAAVLVGSAMALSGFAIPASAMTPDCEPARCAVAAAIETRCPCDAASNHGRHVSCVAHVVREFWKNGDVPTNCKGKITRCAARSTCGKEGAVTCLRDVYGVCNEMGFCEDGLTPCLANTDCVVATKCSTKRSAERCEALGGSVGTSSTCCADCVPAAP